MKLRVLAALPILAGLALTPAVAQAQWHGGWHGAHRGWHGGDRYRGGWRRGGVGPGLLLGLGAAAIGAAVVAPALIAPPPPPPVYYAPPVGYAVPAYPYAPPPPPYGYGYGYPGY